LSSLNTANLRILYYRQFLDERFDIQKNCWVVDDCCLKDVDVMYALVVSYITVFEIKYPIS